MPNKNIGDHELTRFITQLCEYACKKQHSILLVFDGCSYMRLTKESKGNVHVIYLGYHESADDYIHSYVEKHKSYAMLLISFDRELRRKVATCAAVAAIYPENFYRLFLRALRRILE